MDQESNFDSLLNNDFFIEWIKTHPSESEWQAFKAKHPLPDEDLELARSIIVQVTKPPSNEGQDYFQAEVWKNIEKATIPKYKSRLKVFGFLAIGLLALLFIFFKYTQQSPQVDTNIALKKADQWIEYTNTSDSNWPVDLSDGSQVILEPQAKLKYPRHFSKKTRKVQLTGHAFFDIAHDTLKPFYVYTNEALIRVLGTSFYVKAGESDKDVQVIVKTGKVAVYNGKDVVEYRAKKIDRIEPLVVTANQIATLEKSNLKFHKRLVSTPMLTKSLESIKKIHFENTTIHEIALALEKAYGVEIVIDERIKSDCRLTTTLTDQPLFEKLKLICDPLGLEYLEKDVRIYIIGNCKI